MGFKIISDVLLTKLELIKAVHEIQIVHIMVPEQQKDLPIVNLNTPHNSYQGNQYYVRLVKEDPFEYLVFTIDEVINLLRVKCHYNGSRAALCNLLRHAEVPFADDDKENENEDDNDD